jgi:hypothetical protein
MGGAESGVFAKPCSSLSNSNRIGNAQGWLGPERLVYP